MHVEYVSLIMQHGLGRYPILPPLPLPPLSPYLIPQVYHAIWFSMCFLLLSGFGGLCLSQCSLEFGGWCVLVMGFLDVLSTMIYGCGYLGCCGALWSFLYLVSNMVIGRGFLRDRGVLQNLVGHELCSLWHSLKFCGCSMFPMGFMVMVSIMVFCCGCLGDHGALWNLVVVPCFSFLSWVWSQLWCFVVVVDVW